jgi:ubiquinone/menaquinone biosynthesis C-methylase UbiE
VAIDRKVNYEPVAPDYDRRYRENDYSGIQHCLLDFVSDPPSAEVLETGCGTGHWLAVLSQAGCKVAGLELSRQMLAMAKEKVPDLVLVQGRAEAIPWPAQTFDRIVCINAFHHFVNKQDFIQEARRTLRPGGGLLIVGLDPHTDLDRWWIYDYFPQVIDIDRKRFPAGRVIRDMLKQNGFTQCLTSEVQHMPIRLPARYALEKGLLHKNSTSQLFILSQEEYQAGMDRLVRDIESAEASRSPLNIAADLRIYATAGWVE